MVKCFVAWDKWSAIMDTTGAAGEMKLLYDIYMLRLKLVEALVRAGGGAYYPLDVVNKCEYIAYVRMDALKAGGGGGSKDKRS
jgi:hypothetical protein